jgi:heptaprenyl diphosphate synthase
MASMNQKRKAIPTNINIAPRSLSIALLGVLTALALVLSALESLLPPLPVLPPGAKLGLSNIVTMYTAGAEGLLPAVCIAIVKGLFSGMLRGFTAMLMSLCGGVASTFVMWLLLKIPKKPFGLIGLGVGGALTHNAAQLVVAIFLTTPAVVYYIPWLILFGILSGILTGMVLRIIMPLLNRIP